MYISYVYLIENFQMGSNNTQEYARYTRTSKTNKTKQKPHMKQKHAKDRNSCPCCE